VEPELEIALAIAPRTARAFGSAVHAASASSPYGRLPAGVTGAGLCSTSGGFGQIRHPAPNVCLSYLLATADTVIE
jgi:hypothetical protein